MKPTRSENAIESPKKTMATDTKKLHKSSTILKPKKKTIAKKEKTEKK